MLIGILEIKAQSSTPKIEVSKGFPKYSFKYGELNVGILEVASIVKKNEPAHKLIKKARSTHNWSMFFGALGVGGLMAPLQLLIPPLPNENRIENSGRYVWPFIGIGLSAFAIAVPLSVKAEKQAAKSIESYNSGLSNNLDQLNRLELNIGFSPDGLGMSLKF